MLALFDTNIYIGELSQMIAHEQVRNWRSTHVIRLSPVVYHELLRGAKDKSLIYEIGKKTVMLPAPTSKMWEASAEVLQAFVKNFGFSKEVFKLQNDILIALTAKASGALLITQDRHFHQIAKLVDFHLLLYKNEKDAR